MKPEDIDKLEAGRELDEAVHSAFWPEDEILQLPWGDNLMRQCRKPKADMPHSAWFVLPHYSTDIAAAWLVVEKLRQMQRTITLGSLGVLPDTLRWGCNVLRGVRRLETITQAEADTSPLAICRAALKAIAGEQQQEGEGK